MFEGELGVPKSEHRAALKRIIELEKQLDWVMDHRAAKTGGGVNWHDGKGWKFQGGKTARDAIRRAMKGGE